MPANAHDKANGDAKVVAMTPVAGVGAAGKTAAALYLEMKKAGFWKAPHGGSRKHSPSVGAEPGSDRPTDSSTARVSSAADESSRNTDKSTRSSTTRVAPESQQQRQPAVADQLEQGSEQQRQPTVAEQFEQGSESNPADLKPRTEPTTEKRRPPIGRRLSFLKGITHASVRMLPTMKKKKAPFSFAKQDPRRQIADFFRPGDHRGPFGLLASQGLTPSGDGDPSRFFSVWRPTSMDALRMMIEGRACGKGLNIKGKSAKMGKQACPEFLCDRTTANILDWGAGPLSGFVPFLQIHEEHHKRAIGTSPKYARIRVYFKSSASRDKAVAALQPIKQEMLAAVHAAEETLGTSPAHELDSEIRRSVLNKLQWKMDDSRIECLDAFAPDVYGIDCAERLFWEVFVVRQDISHPPGWQTGRGSEPAFMDANLHATRGPSKPTAVLWQYDEDNCMNPRGLLIAYEEEQVRPVASDLDAFLIGSKGVSFEPLPNEQVALIDWCVVYCFVKSTASSDGFRVAIGA